jgi:hypothetical protein
MELLYWSFVWLAAERVSLVVTVLQRGILYQGDVG